MKTPTNSNSRVDGLGRAYAGSQLQIQIYVNRHSEELSHRVLGVLPTLALLKPRLRWVSPLEQEKFIEYQDAAFLRAVGQEQLTDLLGAFWPKGGPNWDALAVVEMSGNLNQHGVLLVEAKSHPNEVYGDGCKASSIVSRKKIENALAETKRWLGLSGEVEWTGPLYQSANRIAHLHFLREIGHVPAWLVNIYFLNDSHSRTDMKKWQKALAQVKEELGLSAINVPHTAELFLEAKDRGELFKE